ncbi:MAG: aconitase X catalytic domain-containing protein [Rhodothermaceae bacterium]|nr:aconitase X catalytic domain-containing protein [Rhodothermaceae bacterium]
MNDLVLTEYDQSILAGEQGHAAKMALSILAKMLPVFGTDRFLDISGAHIDSSLFQGDATLEYAEKLVSLGANVSVPTTLNVGGVDIHGWKDWSVPAEWAEKSHRQMQAYQKMGCVPTWTCAPYQTSHKPTFGQQIAWGESNAIIFANSVIGARTERYPDLLDICAAITGRAPAAGLHLTEHRAGQILVELIDIPHAVQESDTFYPVLGHYIGSISQARIPVIENLEYTPNEDQLKALGAAMASSGAVALFHLIGCTPEAPTRAAAFQHREPEKTLKVTRDVLRTAFTALTTTTSTTLDLVVLGSPHFSFDEIKQLAPLLQGKSRHPDVQFLVTTNRIVRELAKSAGYLSMIEDFGGRITVDTCILTSPMLPTSVKTIMTNSAKYAYYAPGLLETAVVFGSLEDCVYSAVEGRVIQNDSLWR